MNEDVVVTEERTKWSAILIYTLLRIGIFLVAWAIFQYLTPFKGIIGLVLAILVSGAVSFFVLDRQRDAMSTSVFGLFKRMNDRIDAATRAEDVEELPSPESDTEPKQ